MIETTVLVTVLDAGGSWKFDPSAMLTRRV